MLIPPRLLRRSEQEIESAGSRTHGSVGEALIDPVKFCFGDRGDEEEAGLSQRLLATCRIPARFRTSFGNRETK